MSKVWRYGDHVDTDVIIPARYLNISDFKELSEHAMEDIDTTFAPNVKPGDIIVAGRNFGCGSSREHAPIVIQQKGVACIIAESFARIFYRNAINIGLPVLEIGEEAKKIHHQIRHVFQDLESQLMKNIDEPAQQSLQSMLIQILQNIEMEEKTC